LGTIDDWAQLATAAVAFAWRVGLAHACVYRMREKASENGKIGKRIAAAADDDD